MLGRIVRCIRTRAGVALFQRDNANIAGRMSQGVVQTPVHSYDRIEIPEIRPDVTRVTLLGGMCPCCAKPFKAAPPAGLEPGSPFGPNLRAFAIYLRFTQAISFERLSRLLSDPFGLGISEGALVNMARRQQASVRARCEPDP
jgi:transposase